MPAHSPWMTDELVAVADHAARFLAREMIPHAQGWERAGVVDRAAWRKAGDAGLLCAGIPEAYGGASGTYAHEIVIAEQIAAAGLAGGFGLGLGVSCGIVARYILNFGTDEQKQRWLPPMARGDLIGAVAMSEPGAGSDLQGIRTTARRTDGGYVISGSKTFITNGQNADLVVLVAKTDPDAGSRGVSLLVVETAAAEGFRRGRNLEKLGMHAQDTSELFFDEVFVPTSNLLGEVEGQGFVQLMQELAWERLGCAISAVVSMEAAVSLTVDYARQREAFGQPLLAFQNTQFKLAECKTAAVVGRTFVDQLILKLLDGALDPVEAAMAKAWTTETLGGVVDACLQLHGGYGYMADQPIARLWADARVLRIFGGSTEIMKLLISRAL